MTRKWMTGALCLVSVTLAGCRSKEADHHKVGGDLPVTPSSSVALPDATNAADAPRAPEVAESQDATLTTYRDPSTGVSFQYPTVWRPSQGSVLQAPQFSEVAGKPRMTQEFTPKGTYYEPTVLRGSQCLIFERDFVTGCPFTKTDKLPRPLTDKEAADLQHPLDGVMRSVQVTDPARSGPL